MIRTEDIENYNRMVDKKGKRIHLSEDTVDVINSQVYEQYGLINLMSTFHFLVIKRHSAIRSEMHSGLVGERRIEGLSVAMLGKYFDFIIEQVPKKVQLHNMPSYTEGSKRGTYYSKVYMTKKYLREFGIGLYNVISYYRGEEEAYDRMTRYQDEYFKVMDTRGLGLNKVDRFIQKSLYKIELKMLHKINNKKGEINRYERNNR